MNAELRALIEDVRTFSRVMWPHRTLRPYQAEVAAHIARAVAEGTGRQFAIVFARQSGKDELLAQLQAFLMYRYHLCGGSIVVVNPTYRPQAIIGKRRLLDRLSALSPCMRAGTRIRVDGHTIMLGKAACCFLSANPAAQARGETASLMLACNESQEISCSRWDAVFDPIGAAYHATQVFAGTVWVSTTLLARQMAYLSELERKDGIRRVFRVDWEEVARWVPQYGEQVRARIAQLGRDHPFIRTEYFLEELDAGGRLFDALRRARMRGSHPRRRSATPGSVYALLVDVAGADEQWQDTGAWPATDEAFTPFTAARHTRDATALTVVQVDLSGLDDPLVMRPTYQVVDRHLWVGMPHPRLHAAITDLARNVWAARWVVVDATGVGAGLAGFLEQALPGRVVPFVFTAHSKSQLGWDFLGLIDSGRYKEYVEDGQADTGLFWAQVEACTSQVAGGPGKLLRWGVQHRATHDDLLVSAALCAVLDRLDWRPRTAKGR